MNLRRTYETTFIVNAALEDPDVEAMISKVTSYIENNGGEMVEINKWGRRRLAYPINKKYNGYYVHIVFSAKPGIIPILERFLVLEDTILRHLTLILPKNLQNYRAKVALDLGRSYDSAIYDPELKQDDQKPGGRGSYGNRGNYNRGNGVAAIVEDTELLIDESSEPEII